MKFEGDGFLCKNCVHSQPPWGVCTYLVWLDCMNVWEEFRGDDLVIYSRKRLFEPKTKEVENWSEPDDAWDEVYRMTGMTRPDKKEDTFEADTQVAFDPVKRPEHYNYTKIECWDWYELAMSDDEFRGAMKNNIWKYTFRSGHKGNPVGDLKKARAYLDRWIKFEEGKASDQDK